MTALAEVAIGIIQGPWPRRDVQPGNFRTQFLAADGATELFRIEKSEPHLEVPDDPRFAPGTSFTARVVRLGTDNQEYGPVVTAAQVVPPLPQVDLPASVTITWKS